MSLPIPYFGGLNLAEDPEEVGAHGAVDLSNVDFDGRGRVRTRRGLQRVNTTDLAGGGSYYYVFDRGQSGFIYGIRSTGVTTYIDRSNGALPGVWVNIGNYASGIPTAYALLGTVLGSNGFVANRGNQLQRFNSVGIVASVGLPAFVTITGSSNRLVQGNFAAAVDSPTGANGTNSTVFFSEPNLPETYSANNYVHIRPGDGEQISGMVTWNNYVFVFKETTCAIFYSESVGSAGTPIFNYRTITLPSGLSSAHSLAGTSAITAGSDAVYFGCSGGIYRTMGGNAELISGPVQGIFLGTAPDQFTVATNTPLDLAWASEKLYITYQAKDASTKTLVWDRLGNVWTIYSLPTTLNGAAVCLSDTYNDDPTFFASGPGIYRLLSSQTTDDSTAIAARYQSGWFSLADDARSSRLRGVALRGIGSPTMSIFRDYGTTDTLAATVTLGTDPTVARGLHQKSYDGRVFSYKLSSTSGAWEVDTITLNQYP